jgi:hypothetical protein
MFGVRGRLKLLLGLAAAVFAAVIAGCGGGSDGGGGPAVLVPETAPIYLEASLAPGSTESEELNALAQGVLGTGDAGDAVTEALERAALGQGEKVDFEEEIEPWLGEKVGVFMGGSDSGDFHGLGVALETANSGEAEAFIEKRGEGKKGEFEGHTYYVEPGGEGVLGVVDDFVVFAEGKAGFEEMVKASEGEGLSDSSKFTAAMAAAPSQGLGHAYVDIGSLAEEGQDRIQPIPEVASDLLGLELRDATAVASLVPHSEQIEVDVTTNLANSTEGSGDASALLESLPATAVAGFSRAEFGKGFGKDIDHLNEDGIPGAFKPNALTVALGAFGINLNAIAESIGDVGGFVEGSSSGDLGAALVIETDSSKEAGTTIGKFSLLLRSARTHGVTALSGKLSGFSVPLPEFGSKPLVVAVSGQKMAIAYGLKAAAQALRGSSQTLGATADFKAAKAALGSTPIGAFVDAAAALKLLEGTLDPVERRELAEVRPFLQKVNYVGVGSEAKAEETTAKVIIGLSK